MRSAALDERVSLLSARFAPSSPTSSKAREAGAPGEMPGALDDGALERLAGALGTLRDRLDRGIAAAGAERDRRVEASEKRLARLGATRHDREQLEHAMTVDRERRQRLEIERAEAAVRAETAVGQLRREFDVVADEAIAAEAPPLPAGVDAGQRVRQLERELAALGPVNPLAAEELAALVDRRTFLEGQLDDVRSARRNLDRVIAAVDAQIVEAFTAAFADVARHFSALVATLFPGGSGSLHLSEPEDLLSTGVEIEARPAGRNVRRLSLLSGGERALVARRVPVRRVPQPSVAVLRARRGRSGARRRQPRAFPRPRRRVPRRRATPHRQPPETDDGGRRRPLRDLAPAGRGVKGREREGRTARRPGPDQRRALRPGRHPGRVVATRAPTL